MITAFMEAVVLSFTLGAMMGAIVAIHWIARRQRRSSSPEDDKE